MQCGRDCYSPRMYSCYNGELIDLSELLPSSSTAAVATTTSAACPESTQWLSDPPYENYFYSNCHSASQVVVTSPLEDSNLTIIGPRLLVAWPAGNSGVVAFFQSQEDVNGTLALSLKNGSYDFPLHGVYQKATAESLSGNSFVGISTLVHFNSSAVLTVSIIGSIRNIRDFTEGPSILSPIIQNGIKYSETEDGGVMLSRLWLDNMTTTQMTFSPVDGSRLDLSTDSAGNKTINFDPGTYNFTALFDYPQLTQLNASQVLDPQPQDLIAQQPDETTSLSFLSYSQKLLAGAWRFLTYFGRDSMIAALLLQPVLSEGEGGAIEAVIAAVLERLNRTSGVVCHEETIGDYATYVNRMENETSTRPGCTYIMVSWMSFFECGCSASGLIDGLCRLIRITTCRR